MTPIGAALQWLGRSQIDQYLRCQQPSKLFHGPGGELWKSVCRIGKGKAKGGSKCPGPELKEKELKIAMQVAMPFLEAI